MLYVAKRFLFDFSHYFGTTRDSEISLEIFTEYEVRINSGILVTDSGFKRVKHT